MRRLRQSAGGEREKDSFRRLVDRKISVDDYVKHLDRRVQERREAEEYPPNRARSPRRANLTRSSAVAPPTSLLRARCALKLAVAA